MTNPQFEQWIKATSDANSLLCFMRPVCNESAYQVTMVGIARELMHRDAKIAALQAEVANLKQSVIVLSACEVE